MDLWWPSHDIFTGTYAPSVVGSIGANLPEVGSDFATNLPSLQPLQSPFDSTDRNNGFSDSLASSHMVNRGI